MAMNVIAILDRLRTQVAGRGPLHLHLVIGTKVFQHRIEALRRPGQQLAKTVDGHPIVTFSDTPIGGLKLLALRFRV